MKYSDAHRFDSRPQSGRLLIIDDDDVLLSALPWPIKRRMPSMNIDTADTPEEALRHVYSDDYDVILSDIRMPRMDGVTLLRKLRAIQPETPEEADPPANWSVLVDNLQRARLNYPIDPQTSAAPPAEKTDS